MRAGATASACSTCPTTPTTTTRCRRARCARTRADYHALIKQARLRDGAGLRRLRARGRRPRSSQRWQSALEARAPRASRSRRSATSPRPARARLLCVALERDASRATSAGRPLAPEITALFFFDGLRARQLGVRARGRRAVGFCFVLPDDPTHARSRPAARCAPGELNMLAIGVRAAGRGRGINYAMAATATSSSSRAAGRTSPTRSCSTTTGRRGARRRARRVAVRELPRVPAQFLEALVGLGEAGLGALGGGAGSR